jgi:16S rRNA (adenine1518-N6/adenine1519-N6)-dimethyltransferase
MDLCSVREVKALLAEHGLSPKKAFGQNFLIDPTVPERIAESAADTVRSRPTAALEIGPGVGALTAQLAGRFDRVVAVEIDRGLIPVLGETLAEFDNAQIVEGDFLDLDLTAFLAEKFEGYDVAVCANLPYYVTTPIMMRFFDAFPASKPLPVSSLTFMVQREVADRICSSSAAGDYGAVAASIALAARADKLFSVPPGCFYPAPSVTSAVMRLTPHEKGIRSVYPDAPADDAECDRFAAQVRRTVAAAFCQRRKTLVNALSGLYPKDRLNAAVERCGLRPDIRGEKLSASDFCRLTDELSK